MTLSRVVLEIAGLLTVAVFLGLVARRLRLPLTVVLVIVGLAASATGVVPSVGQLEGEAFENLVIIGFLPVLVFAAALGMDVRAFLRNLGAIVTLALVGFALSAVLVGLAVHLLLGTALVVALLFGALISATDPVAVVAIFRELGVPRRLLTVVEGESLLNDGVAIVLFAILLEVSLGGSLDVVAGVGSFVLVFLGGAAIGAVVGFAAAAVLPWLDPLAAVALSLAVAYGTFVLAEEVLGFSGVIATAVAGMVLAGTAPSRGSAEVRQAWDRTWEALDYTANALLFLLIGLALDLATLIDTIGPVLVAVAAVLLARAVAVVPLVWVLERVANVPRIGWRNEAVLVWGGLRGGVALALALALPPELPARDTLVALTGGVVLATLLLNATSIRWLVHRLGLDEPDRVDRFLSLVARMAGVRAARERLDELGLADARHVQHRLDEAEQRATQELRALRLDPAAETRVVLGRGLHIERETYQALSDQGLLPRTVTRALLHQVDDEVDDLSLGRELAPARRRSGPPRVDRWSRAVLAWLPEPPGADPEELAYAEASARRLAARRTADALELFQGVAAIRRGTVARARETFARWEQQALQRLDELDGSSGVRRRELHERQAALLARAATQRELTELARTGLLPRRLAEAELEDSAASGTRDPGDD